MAKEAQSSVSYRIREKLEYAGLQSWLHIGCMTFKRSAGWHTRQMPQDIIIIIITNLLWRRSTGAQQRLTECA